MPTFYSQSWTEIVRSILSNPSFYDSLDAYDRLSFRDRILCIREDVSLTLCKEAKAARLAFTSSPDPLTLALEEAEHRILQLRQLNKEST